MLVDILREVPREQVTDGVILYRFPLDIGVAKGEYVLDPYLTSQKRCTLFFCCSGALSLCRKHCADIEIERNDIILLSDYSNLISVVVRDVPVGYCLVIDPATCSVFNNMHQMLGHTSWSYEDIQVFLQKCGGYLKIKHSIWKQSLFSVLNSLPDAEQGPYCVMKAAELYYLFRTRQSVYNDIARQCAMPDYLTEQLICIGTYIENHLDEKLTISQLCRQFNLSPTALKNKFREFYGQPIHNWIQYRRIHRAAELLQSTNMTVLQVAQSIGYESVSQFNVIFRRTYGTSPSLYKKCLIPQKIADSVGKNDHSMLLYYDSVLSVFMVLQWRFEYEGT